MKRVTLLFFSTFFFSRLFYVISHPLDFSAQDSLLAFFIMPDYNLSLMWWIFWFIGALYLSVKKWNLRWNIYIDIVAISFLFAWIIWYLWAFMWGQIIWAPTDSSFWILLNNPNLEYQVPLLPLALFYSWACLILFIISYILRRLILIDWLVWYSAIFIFSIIIISFDQLWWTKYWLFVEYTRLSLSQIWAIIMIFISLRWFKNIYFKVK